MFVLGLFLLGFTAVFSYLWFGVGGVGAGVPFFSFWTLPLLLFWGTGFGILFFAINNGCRRGIVDAVDGSLLVTQQDLTGTREYAWLDGAVRRIWVGPSGLKVNNEPVLCLRIRGHDGNHAKLFRERRDDELYWLAALIVYHLTPAPEIPAP